MGWGGKWEGGSGWGTHVNPWLIHINVWQKPLQNCKVISLQLIKINEKKRRNQTHQPYLTSTVQAECASMVVLVEISQKSKLKQLTMVRNSEYLIHRGTSIKEPEFNTIASPC